MRIQSLYSQLNLKIKNIDICLIYPGLLLQLEQDQHLSSLPIISEIFHAPKIYILGLFMNEGK